MLVVNIIGLDAHRATYTMAVRNETGEMVSCHRQSTSEEHLIEDTSRVPGDKWLVVEESHLAQWIYMTLKGQVDKLTVCDPRHNRLIAKADFVDDRVAAIKLTELARLDALKEVYHPDAGLADLRSLFLHDYDLDVQVTRFKNKTSAAFRQVGICASGSALYEPDARPGWLAKLQAHGPLAHRAQHGFRAVDLFEEMKQDTYTRMVRLAQPLPAFEWLCSLPGAGPMIATGYLAIIITPHRFDRRSKLWRYARLGFKKHLSDDRVYQQGASRHGHPVLKWLVREHFHHAVEDPRTSNRFQRQYETLLRSGTPETHARRVVCRSLLSTVRAIWMKGESYRDRPLN